MVMTPNFLFSLFHQFSHWTLLVSLLTQRLRYIFFKMSSNSSTYSSTFLKAIKPFSIEEFEELVFGTPLTPIKRLMWEWVTSMTPPSTPALANYSVSSPRASVCGFSLLYLHKRRLPPQTVRR
ncbi:hypothetical protein O181_120993 [Austropuccinia psidii MF-1]|uniref:Uncharacterized protein n=1 Tax=Austropuccinia psidii MF-1 TaxID=1389203 RepID=A0A9Q3KGQ5_9BASI|nr:hypothetical protein [Austropuccinia psidii MF-1]